MKVNTNNPCANYQNALNNSTSLKPDELEYLKKIATICEILHDNIEKGRKNQKERENLVEEFSARLDRMYPPKKKT